MTDTKEIMYECPNYDCPMKTFFLEKVPEKTKVIEVKTLMCADCGYQMRVKFIKAQDYERLRA